MFMSTSCKLYIIKFEMHFISTFTAMENKALIFFFFKSAISEKRVSFALSGPPEGYSVNSIKEDAL